MKMNQHYNELKASYLFVDINHRVAAFQKAHPDRDVIRLGIGDVTRPLAKSVVKAMQDAVAEMGSASGFHGYGPEQGYDFLREAVQGYYAGRGVRLEADEIFISDGAKCDVGNFQELFAQDCVVAVMDPVYPVYVDSNVMAGRAGELTERGWNSLVYLPCTRDNDFVPDFPATRPDIIYLCYPNNPTGTVLRRDALTAWVDYARREGCLILYDSAYEAFIREADVPHSIYEIDGAREVAVEFRSYSKTAGFTGLRCAYTVVPHAVRISNGKGGTVSLNAFWNRRQCTKYNGCPYIVQRAAEAVHSEQGRREAQEIVDGYLANGARIANAVRGMGLEVYGGKNAPYLWVRVPADTTSWGFFDRLLHKAALVCTPGVGFGLSGEGYVRLTAFGSTEDTTEAIERLRSL